MAERFRKKIKSGWTSDFFWLWYPFFQTNNGRIPKRSNGADCKSAGNAFEGSNPSPTTILLGSQGLFPLAETGANLK
jgi:hypothetical protein